MPTKTLTYSVPVRSKNQHLYQQRLELSNIALAQQQISGINNAYLYNLIFGFNPVAALPEILMSVNILFIPDSQMA